MKSILALAGAVSASNLLETKFIEYLAQHGKSYATHEEFQLRLSNFAHTDGLLEQFNAEPHPSTVGHNKFSDWSEAEKRALYGLTPEAETGSAVVAADLPTDDLPESVNWVEAGAVNAVQDQGQCGSCWAFSAIGAMEGQHFIQSGELLKLSEQECVDCDLDSFGCKGGWPDNCFWYTHDNNGINLEETYPYTAYTDRCFAPYNGPVQVTAVNHVTGYVQDQLMAAVALGPVSVTINADSTAFSAYTSGVIQGADCNTKLDHAVLAVGYGTDEATGLDYWLVKNSWGESWGDKGYVKLAREGDGYGVCGIQKISYWPMTN